MAHARLDERTRIAQNLHDNLLQGFLSVSMQMQAAVNQLPDDSAARRRFGNIAEMMSRVVEQGRLAVQGLRSSREPHDLSLAQALAEVPGELQLSAAVQFRVVVLGDHGRLDPSRCEDAYLICREAIVNAWRHSGGNEIEAELAFRPSGLRITVRDNGRGIDREELQSKQNNHWGMQGMQERAERIGARLRVLSKSGLGTEVELFLPAAVSGCRPRD